ncbi:hypothetical protein [Roseibacillus persicicus]|nr:hypothetical protein [Roseibacillus persicicus]MDQ8190726.1 hypothetical protein [Roseibacillus persicicus]
MKANLIFAFCLGALTCLGEEELLPSLTPLAGQEESVFREIGSFQVTKSVVTRLGETTEVNKGELILRVFTDGIDIRLSPEGQDEDFLAFQIYRSGGVFDVDGENLSPGVQAFSDQGEVVRHLVINAKLLTITKFPTSSSDVEIIYATRYER